MRLLDLYEMKKEAALGGAIRRTIGDMAVGSASGAILGSASGNTGKGAVLGAVIPFGMGLRRSGKAAAAAKKAKKEVKKVIAKRRPGEWGVK